MDVTVRAMVANDYEGVSELWRGAEGVGLSSADSREGVEAFLERNPGLSLVALHEGTVVAAILCGHDGRRGYVSHLAVAEPHRRRGVASELVGRCIARLREAGIEKCHLFVFRTNDSARAFWNKTGWSERVDLTVHSKFTDESAPGSMEAGPDGPEVG
jgi:putative acetyltransferase